jgi:hypothetical protein
LWFGNSDDFVVDDSHEADGYCGQTRVVFRWIHSGGMVLNRTLEIQGPDESEEFRFHAEKPSEWPSRGMADPRNKQIFAILISIAGRLSSLIIVLFDLERLTTSLTVHSLSLFAIRNKISDDNRTIRLLSQKIIKT